MNNEEVFKAMLEGDVSLQGIRTEFVNHVMDAVKGYTYKRVHSNFTSSEKIAIVSEKFISQELVRVINRFNEFDINSEPEIMTSSGKLLIVFRDMYRMAMFTGQFGLRLM